MTDRIVTLRRWLACPVIWTRGMLLAAGAAVGILLAGSVVYTITQTQAQAERERGDIMALRRERVQSQAQSDLTLCRDLAKTERALVQLIEGVLALPRRAGESRERVEQREALLRGQLDSLAPTDCERLPSQRPFRSRP